MKPGFWDASSLLTEEQNLFTVSFDLFCRWGEDGSVRPYNLAWERVLGWKQGDLQASWVELLHPEDRGKWLDEVASCAVGESFEIELRCRHRDKSYRCLTWRVLRTTKAELWGAGQDISELRCTQVRYEMLSDLFQKLVGIYTDTTTSPIPQALMRMDNIPYRPPASKNNNPIIPASDYVFSASVTPEGQVVTKWVTESFQEITGYSLEELHRIGDWGQIIHPEDLVLTSQSFERLLQNHPVTTRYRIITKSGKIRWLHDSVRPVWDGKRVVAVLGACRDITQQQEAEAALKRSEQLYRTLAQNFPNGAVLLFDKEGRYLLAEGQGLTMVGLSRESLEGKTYFEVLPRQISKQLKPIYKATLAGESTVTEICYNKRHYQLHTCGVKNEEGEICSGLMVVSDITERKQAEEALRVAAKRERLMSVVRDRIRQSLNIETILKTTVEEVRQFLDTDRVLIYRFQPDWTGKVAVESVDSGWTHLHSRSMQVSEFTQTCISYYQRGHVYTVEDVNRQSVTVPHLALLQEAQVKGLLVVPILYDSVDTSLSLSTMLGARDNLSSHGPRRHSRPLWGLLVANHCRAPRQWQAQEVELLSSLANQLSIAIQQAELYQQLALANMELQRLASCDCLTGVANRRRFDEFLAEQWQRSLSVRNPVSLLLCDVDFFKLYNDTYGHIAGDECLQKVAAAIRASLNRPGDLVARYGGEEFAVVLPSTDWEEALYIAESIRRAVKGLSIPHRRSSNQYVTMSVGVASVVPTTEWEPSHLIAEADCALYSAKASGRDQCCSSRLNNALSLSDVSADV
ncbi:diguanylate cyclase [Ancylothrix sp. C2]|uniref:sensor domain-containing diguanylate cyclase n=1 Tax=Ancylothrix sp. D3o TaxID=2953691 RepID=UPI0021BA48C0|nr:diguanylate cyclase [Ancylothrix sp. D3o]MCT7949108.1 diguanylate cyclase [Ancylothrix sp. D3o]